MLSIQRTWGIVHTRTYSLARLARRKSLPSFADPRSSLSTNFWSSLCLAYADHIESE
jgi:hypothetical protein